MKKNSILISLFLPCALLSPNVMIISGLPAFRAEDIVILLVACRSLTSNSNRFINFQDKTTKLFIFMMFMSGISIVFPAMVYGHNLIFRDFMIVPMLIRYYLIYAIAKSVSDSKTLRYSLYFVVIASAISITVGLCQKFNAFGVNQWLSPIYIHRDRWLELMLQGYYKARIGGTHGDPRRFAYMLVVFIGLYISIAFYMKASKIKTIIYPLLFMALLTLLFTLSRTGIIALVGVLFVFSFILIKKSSTKANKMLRLLFVGLMVAVFIASLQGKTITKGFEERVLTTDSVSFQRSLRGRIRDFFKPIKDALENPLVFFVGRGPAKEVMITSSHNDWGWVFHRFGLPGLLFYFFLIWNGIRAGYKASNIRKEGPSKVLLMTALFTVISWIIYVNAEDIFKDAQIMSINMFALGLLNNRWLTVSRATKLTNRVWDEKSYKTLPLPKSAFAR